MQQQHSGVVMMSSLVIVPCYDDSLLISLLLLWLHIQNALSSISFLLTVAILHSFNTHSLDGPISSVQLFTISTTPANDEGDVPLHLLATSATEVGAVFR